MTISHLNRLRKELEQNHWVILAENPMLGDESNLYWDIARPNGDTPLRLIFSPGFGGKHGDLRLDNIEEAIACEVLNLDIEYLYFPSRYSGKFQRDVVEFVERINAIT